MEGSARMVILFPPLGCSLMLGLLTLISNISMIRTFRSAVRSQKLLWLEMSSLDVDSSMHKEYILISGTILFNFILFLILTFSSGESQGEFIAIQLLVRVSSSCLFNRLLPQLFYKIDSPLISVVWAEEIVTLGGWILPQLTNGVHNLYLSCLP